MLSQAIFLNDGNALSSVLPSLAVARDYRMERADTKRASEQ